MNAPPPLEPPRRPRHCAASEALLVAAAGLLVLTIAATVTIATRVAQLRHEPFTLQALLEKLR